MAVLQVLFVLLTCVPEVAAILLQQEMRLGQQNSDGALQTSLAASSEDSYYKEQRVDHFNSDDNRSWAQRYFVNFTHLKKGGPIFIYIGGEGPLSNSSVSGRTANAYFAEQVQGGTIALEHRFYGKSQPFDSLATENLRYLTSQQALHDLAQFQTWITGKYSLAGSNFFCMGGSYPGNLAAWYRLKFPNMTSGCWSASGPVHAVQNWPGFGEMVWKAVATDAAGVRDDSVAVKLYAGYEQVAALIHDASPEAWQLLSKKLNICPGSVVSQDDRDNLESLISTAPGLVMQYNNTKAPHLASIREIVIGASTPLDAALGVTKFLNLTAGEESKCADNSIGAFYRLLSDTTLPSTGMGNAARTWTWQTCNEFGYFQKGTSTFEKPTMYTRGASNKAMWEQVCEEIFGIAVPAVGARIAATNQYYGGKDPQGITHVYFTNGGLDAWSLLSVTTYPSNGREVYAEVVPLGSHCVGLYSPSNDEVPGTAEVRNRALSLFQQWAQSSQGSTFFA